MSLLHRILISIILVFSVLFIPTTVLAINANDKVCDAAAQNVNPDAQTPIFCSDTSTENPIVGPTGVLTKVIQGLVYAGSIIAVVVIIVGGIRYVVSGGDSAGVKGAKDSIMYALVGLVVAMLAQAIIAFVLNKL